MLRPRVSILIPNYNNGRESSISGKDDLLGNLLVSLMDTLKGEPVPFEIIAYDDGSTDDSLATLRNWAKIIWPSGQPFLELIEAKHCGYLSRIANVLSRKAAGDILVRLDGDIVCLTPNWVSKLCDIFDQGPPHLGVVAPKQLRPDGRIHACGDFVLHPNGYSHVGNGLPREAIKHPLPVDHAMGCFHCMKKTAYEATGGYDEEFLRGQTEDLGLRVLLKGWTCLAVPQIEFVHYHTQRFDRATTADSNEGIRKTLEHFERKWGFSRLAPNLDEVRRRYAGTPLLWNKRWFGDASPAVRAEPLTIETTSWSRYARDTTEQMRVNARVGAIIDVARQAGNPSPVVALGAGDGLYVHLLATRGLTAFGLDLHPAHVAFARACVANQKYPAGRPRFELQRDPRVVSIPDGQVEMVLIFDELERHPNPVALINEAARILVPGGFLIAFSQRLAVAIDPSDPTLPQNRSSEHPYVWSEFVNQINSTKHWALLIDPKDDKPGRDMCVVAQRRGVSANMLTFPPPSNEAARPVQAAATAGA